MNELREQLERLRVQVNQVQNAPILQKAARAEQALINAYNLLASMVEKLEYQQKYIDKYSRKKVGTGGV